MGDWPRLVNLRRCARGRIIDQGEDTNTTLSLYNDSLGPELILVWQVMQDVASLQALQFSYQKIGPYGTKGVVQPIVPGDARPPGILSAGDDATLYTPDFVSTSTLYGFPWPATFPFAVLQPGWAFIMQSFGNPTTGIGADLFWEGILSEYFDRVHTFRQLELDIIARQGS